MAPGKPDIAEKAPCWRGEIGWYHERAFVPWDGRAFNFMETDG